MKRIFLIAFALALSGCATVKVSHEDRTTVYIENSSWYLFNFIPIASGNPMLPNANDCVWFEKTVTLDSNMRMLQWAVVKEGANGARDISSYITDESVFILLLQRHAYHTSAELIME